MNRKSIMLIVPNLVQGGQQKICLMTAYLLGQDEKYDVCVVVFDGTDAFYSAKGLNLIDISLPAKKGIIRKILQVAKRTIAVKKIKTDKSVDCSYSFGRTANMVNVFSKGKEKVFVGVREYLALKNRLQRILVYQKADKVVCCSKSMESDAAKIYGIANTVTITNPVDIEGIQQKAREKTVSLRKGNEKIIVTVGRVDEIKGYWHLLKAFALVKKEYENVRLVHIGEGNPEQYVKLAKNLGVENSVKFLGVKKNPFPYIADADLYVLSSISEGFPNALVEAMALGLPVISTDCKSGPREILHQDTEAAEFEKAGIVYADYGVLVPAMDGNVNWNADIVEKEEIYLSDAVLEMLKDETKRMKYKQESLSRIKDFTVQKYMVSLDKLLDNPLII